MFDKYNRKITYLRISVTDLCNLRCIYCMPQDGVIKKNHDDVLSFEEFILASKIATKLGIEKIRITGGEPLVKKDILKLISNIRKCDGLKELCLTTNGVNLKNMAKDLKLSGIDRINVSLDTLNEDKYKRITRLGNISNTILGIKEALNQNFKKIKINVVLIKGFNDDEIINFINLTKKYPIDIRFIELMPMIKTSIINEKSYLSSDFVIYKLLKEYKNEIENISLDNNYIESLKKNYPDLDEINFANDSSFSFNKNEVAKLVKIKGALGKVGIISPISNSFCSNCNRIRLTYDGKLKPCLHSSDEYSIKGLNENEMIEIFKKVINNKPKEHSKLDFNNMSSSNRTMNKIGG